MPKPLDKKKVSGSVNNQKSITQFFRCDNLDSKKNVQVQTYLTSPTVKRKTSSPEDKLNTVKNENDMKKICLEFKARQSDIASSLKVNNINSIDEPTDDPVTVPMKSTTLYKLKTPEKVSTSPIKENSANAQYFEDVFADDWSENNILEGCPENLDLKTMQRCEIVNIEYQPTSTVVRLENANNEQGTCRIEGIWQGVPLSLGQKVSILAGKQESNSYIINNSTGLLVLNPDHLMSTTSVVAGVFCKRKAILQERFRGIDAANEAMTIGILIHELVQKALTENIKDVNRLRQEANNVIKQSISMLYDAGLSIEATKNNMEMYLLPLAQFMQTYVSDYRTGNHQQSSWKVEKVLDIEENICCPQLGLKGKIDATLEVNRREGKGRKSDIIALELKSGRPTESAEHRGQIILYGMMLNIQNDLHPTEYERPGMLLYLREKSDVREVRCGHNEKRDLIMLRNQLVQYLAQKNKITDTEKITDIEDAEKLLIQPLPEPVHNENCCAKCPYLTVCSLNLWHTEGPKVSESHPLSRLRSQALDHLSSEHIKYFLKWNTLLELEKMVQMSLSPLDALWTEEPENRKKRGVCDVDLKLKSVQNSGDRYLHIFDRKSDNASDSKSRKGPQEGEFCIVSLRNRPWIAAGVINLLNAKELHIHLERDLSRRFNKDTKFYIDSYESYATTVQNLTNLGVLLDDTEQSDRLRRLIIDKDQPQFEQKLPRDVGRLGTKMMKSLNIEQQRAVLKALSAKHYVLLQGLPGTGKTQTISVLIQMLVALKQKVLVTAHTHSAVDNVLNRLPSNLKIIRLGSSTRVSKSLQSRCEQHLAKDCDTPEKLDALYESMEVVGVTCLGSSHAMLARTKFDVCIVDEATQVPQSTVLRPLLSCDRFVLVGDPEQLPPVVRSRAARRLGMEESLFHRLKDNNATITLQLQYRMNDKLTSLANSVAYDGRLKCANERIRDAFVRVNVNKIARLYSSKPWILKPCSPQMEDAAIFIDMGSKEMPTGTKSLVNSDEACVVLMLAEVLVQGGVDQSDIGVIAPYRDQVSLLRRAINNLNKTPSVEVSTVDQFQGRDKSVIIYSCTRYDEALVDVKEGEVLNDQRRLAVSVTRAKHKLLVVGHALALQRYTAVNNMIKGCSNIKLNKEDKIDLIKNYEGYCCKDI